MVKKKVTKPIKKPAKRKAATAKVVKVVIGKKKMGRPEIFTPELVEEFLLRIVETNRGIHTICKAIDMPSIRTVFKWLNDEDKDFSQRYARAKELQGERLRDEMLEIADTVQESTRTIMKAGKKVTIKSDNTERAKLKLDTRKFLIVRLAPKQFGNKAEITHNDTEQPLFPDPEDK